jgi:hypothetical protein
MFRNGRQKIRPSVLCLILLTRGTRGSFTELQYIITEGTVSSQCSLCLSRQPSCTPQLRLVLPLLCTDLPGVVVSWRAFIRRTNQLKL